jgi:hypothetical protein
MQMSFNRIAYAQIPRNLLDVRKLQCFLEAPLLVDDIVGSRMLVGSVQDGFSQTIDVVVGNTFRVGKLPGYLDRDGNLGPRSSQYLTSISMPAGRISGSLRRYSGSGRDR